MSYNFSVLGELEKRLDALKEPVPRTIIEFSSRNQLDRVRKEVLGPLKGEYGESFSIEVNQQPVLRGLEFLLGQLAETHIILTYIPPDGLLKIPNFDLAIKKALAEYQFDFLVSALDEFEGLVESVLRYEQQSGVSPYRAVTEVEHIDAITRMSFPSREKALASAREAQEREIRLHLEDPVKSDNFSIFMNALMDWYGREFDRVYR